MTSNWRLLVLCTTLCRLCGALLCFAGTICVAVEASYLKYAWTIRSGEGGYAWGNLGWTLFEYGALSISFEGFASLFYSSMEQPSLQTAWPFYPSADHPLRHSIRDGALGVGFFLIGLGAGSLAFAYPDEAALENMNAWTSFYRTRHDNTHLHNGTSLLFVGSALLVVSVGVISVYCERLDVLYILPCSRCNHERQLAHETEGGRTCCLHLDRPQPVACVVRSGCTAIYQNNWLGAFFNHIYPAYAFYLVGAIVWRMSLDVTVYSPFSETCALPRRNVYDHGLVYGCHQQHEDAGYYLLVSSALLITGATLFAIHALVYYLSILLNRPFVVNNFAPSVGTRSVRRYVQPSGV